MRWSAALSEAQEYAEAVDTLAERTRETLGAAPDLVLLFASPHHAAAWNDPVRRVHAAFPSASIVGCSGGGVIGDAFEVEHRRAVAMVGATLPGVRLHAFAIAPTSWPDDDDDPDPTASWREHLELPEDFDPSAMLLFPEPFGGQAERLVEALGRAFPAMTLFGGVASGAPFPGGSALFLDGRALPLGAVGVAFSGDISFDVIVSQGCRAVGPPLLVTKAEGTEIFALGDQAPRDALRSIYDSLGEADQQLFRKSLFIGVEPEPERVQHQAGHWLVRNIRGIDAESGALALAARIAPWQVVQFLVRDAHAAEADLRERLQAASTEAGAPDAILLLTCMGRGVGLFGSPNHDADLCVEQLGRAPLGGVFCNGEIGPVGDRTFVHGYTTVVAIIRGQRAEPAPEASGRDPQSAPQM